NPRRRTERAFEVIEPIELTRILQGLQQVLGTGVERRVGHRNSKVGCMSSSKMHACFGRNPKKCCRTKRPSRVYFADAHTPYCIHISSTTLIASPACISLKPFSKSASGR